MRSKFYNPRPSSSYYYCRRSTILILFFLVGFAGFVLGFIAISRQGLGYNCKHAEPRSVSVVWDKGNDGGSMSGGISEYKRHKVMGFVGIQTGFGSAARRRSLCQTRFPSDHQGLQNLEETTGLAFRFVIGRPRDGSRVTALMREVAEYDDFVLLDIEEEYSKLPYKTSSFTAVSQRADSLIDIPWMHEKRSSFH